MLLTTMNREGDPGQDEALINVLGLSGAQP